MFNLESFDLFYKNKFFYEIYYHFLFYIINIIMKIQISFKETLKKLLLMINI
jgi:hypothetical protein